jgi:hypothetical protein
VYKNVPKAYELVQAGFHGCAVETLYAHVALYNRVVPNIPETLLPIPTWAGEGVQAQGTGRCSR